MTTAQEFATYVASLPEIYREILAAFPRIVPNRRPGYGLAYQSLWADFEQRGLGVSLGELIGACEQLAANGLVEIKHGISVHPTDKGEQLIKSLSQKPE